MKKLILAAAIVLGGLSTINAQTQDQNTAPTEQKAPATDEFTEIKAEEVPAAVSEALKKAFPDAVQFSVPVLLNGLYYAIPVIGSMFALNLTILIACA